MKRRQEERKHAREVANDFRTSLYYCSSGEPLVRQLERDWCVKKLGLVRTQFGDLSPTFAVAETQTARAMAEVDDDQFFGGLYK